MFKAPGRIFLLVAGILFIIFGVATLLLIAPFSLVTTLSLMPEAAEVEAVYGIDVNLLLIYSVLMFPLGIFYIVVGILAIVFRNRPKKATLFIVMSAIIIVLQICSIIFSAQTGETSADAFLGFIVPVLLLVGGLLNRKATPQINDGTIQDL